MITYETGLCPLYRHPTMEERRAAEREKRREAARAEAAAAAEAEAAEAQARERERTAKIPPIDAPAASFPMETEPLWPEPEPRRGRAPRRRRPDDAQDRRTLCHATPEAMALRRALADLCGMAQACDFPACRRSRRCQGIGGGLCLMRQATRLRSVAREE